MTVSDASAYVRRAWQGRVPFRVSYWLLGVGGNMSFVALLVLIWLGGGRGALAWLWLVFGVSLAWFVFIFVSIWRASACYDGPRLWAMLARAGVCVGIARMAGEAGLLLWLA